MQRKSISGQSIEEKNRIDDYPNLVLFHEIQKYIRVCVEAGNCTTTWLAIKAISVTTDLTDFQGVHTRNYVWRSVAKVNVIGKLMHLTSHLKNDSKMR